MRDQEPRLITRRDALGIIGVVIGGAAIAAYKLGENNANSEFQAVIDPALEQELIKNGFFIYKPNGETIDSLRNAGADVSYSPWLSDAGFEKEASRYPWIGVNPEHFYLPKDEYDFQMQLRGSLRRESRVLQEALNRDDIKLVAGEAVDYVALDQAYKESTGHSLIMPGFIMTKTIQDDLLVGVGRFGHGEGLSYDLETVVRPDSLESVKVPSRFWAAGILVPTIPENS